MIRMTTKSILLLLVVLLSGCNAIERAPSSTTLPTEAPAQVSGTAPTKSPAAVRELWASGVVMPGQQAQLAFALSGSVEAVNVSLGDVVQPGQILAQLAGQESLQAAVSAAQFELVQSEQALKDLDVQVSPAWIAAMQQMVTYAQQVQEAQFALDNYTVPSTQAEMDALEALDLMKQRLDEARQAFDEVRSRPVSDPVRLERKEALDEAQSEYNSAVRRFQLEYNLKIAQAQLEQAQADYVRYQSGPDPDKVLLAEARRANAETQLAAAQAALKNLDLVAPIGGVVTALEIHTGGWVLPGQVVLTLVDVANLHIETTDLSELDIPQIAPGQKVTVYIKALNLEVSGRVSAIAPLADRLGGEVVYKTTIVLDSIPPGLRAGMSVEVRFVVGR